MLVTADLDELLALSDRVVVAFSGELSDALPAADLNVRRLGALMTGSGAAEPSVAPA